MWSNTDVAEVVLDRCMVSNPRFKDPGDNNYTVIMNYEFLEDFAIPTEKWVDNTYELARSLCTSEMSSNRNLLCHAMESVQ